MKTSNRFSFVQTSSFFLSFNTIAQKGSTDKNWLNYEDISCLSVANLLKKDFFSLTIVRGFFMLLRMLGRIMSLK